MGYYCNYKWGSYHNLWVRRWRLSVSNQSELSCQINSQSASFKFFTSPTNRWRCWLARDPKESGRTLRFPTFHFHLVFFKGMATVHFLKMAKHRQKGQIREFRETKTRFLNIPPHRSSLIFLQYE